MHVKNFRSINEETLYFDKLTALIGSNGSGKSTLLNALSSFFDIKYSTFFDFHNKHTKNDIKISITFSNIPDDLKNEFKSYIRNDELTITKLIKLENNNNITITYHGLLFKNPKFDMIRNAENVESMKKKYNLIKLKYRKLKQNCSTKQDINDSMIIWEQENPKKCELVMDDGNFFKHNGIKIKKLQKYINFQHVPAVRDATQDSNEGTNSTITKLADMLIRNKLEQNEFFVRFQKNTNKKYNKIVSNSEELENLNKALTKNINNYVKGSGINLTFSPGFEIPLPVITTQLIEDDYKTITQNTGHGLQRIFIMVLLQSMSEYKKINSVENTVSEIPTVVLIIDEPELYQHPNRQRKIFDIFYKLAYENTEFKSNIQIIYSTHSSYFLNLKIIGQIKVLKKEYHNPSKLKSTKIISTNLDEIIKKFNEIHNHEYSIENIKKRFMLFNNQWINEGFFSKGVILVEGDGDKEILLQISNMKNIDLISHDISIIPCHGKENLDKAVIIFQQFKIPTYTIWDNDKKCENDNPNSRTNKDNIILLKLHGKPRKDYPVEIENNFACVDHDIETVFKRHLGDAFDVLVSKTITENSLCIENDDIFKNPISVSLFFDELRSSKKTIPDILDQILNKIVQLLI